MNKTLLRSLSLFAGVLLFSTPLAASVSPARLTCENLENPLGIDTSRPRLGWILEAKARAQTQTAFQVLVASTETMLEADRGDLWDSGKVESNDSLEIAYAGKPLASTQRCWWKVRIWDQDGKASAYSHPACLEMGLLSAADWQGKWIAPTTDTNSLPAPLLRRAFKVDGRIKQARLYIAGLGYYELHLNGRKVGDHLLDPGYTRFDRRVLYVAYDVTRELRRGGNALGVILGNGWFNVQTRAVWNFHEAPWRAAPKLLLQLNIEYADGRTESIVTDSRWLASTGPILFNSIYGGETYDARLEQPGWDTAGYDDSNWRMAQAVEPPSGKLVAQTMPPIKAGAVLKPVKLSEPQPGVFVFDLGQNLAGFANLTVQGPAGSRVTLKYSERIDKNGMIDRKEIAQHVLRVDTNQQFQTDTYILKGKGVETWHSRFTYHGFQYVEVTGFPGRPTLDSLRGVFIHSAIAEAGTFECSNPLLNKIWRAGRWSYLSNLQGIPTDCPHREKNGWTGDAHLAAEQGLFNFAPAAVYAKWINDLGDEQRPSGELPGIVPTSGWGYHWGNGPAWDSAFLLIPCYTYEYCGDSSLLRGHYEGMKRYVDYLTSKAQDGIVSIGLNDWAPYKTQTPGDITSTAYYYVDAKIVALAARLTGNADDEQKYSELAGRIKEAFNRKFYHAETGLYGNGSQTSLSCALYQGLVEPENRARVVQNLVAAVDQANGHIDTGILGAKYLLNTLADNGRADVAFRIVTQTNQPSWGWWINQGATTLWEEWNGGASRNHIMYGDISAWFYKTLAGLNPDSLAPGFHHFTVKPHLLGLTSASASYNSVRGPLASEWRLVNNRLELKVVVPPNTTATIYVPSADPATVREGGRPCDKVNGLKFLRSEPGYCVLEAGSGSYHFTAPQIPPNSR